MVWIYRAPFPPSQPSSLACWVRVPGFPLCRVAPAAAGPGGVAAFPQPCWSPLLGAGCFMGTRGCVCTEWMSQALAGHRFTANQFSPVCSPCCLLGGEKGACRGDRAEGRACLQQAALRAGLQPCMGRQERGAARDGEERGKRDAAMDPQPLSYRRKAWSGKNKSAPYCITSE